MPAGSKLPSNQVANQRNCAYLTAKPCLQVFELKEKTYAVMEQEQAAHAAALVDCNQSTPSIRDLGPYLRPMPQQQHAYIAQVAVHMQLGQRIENDALTKHITKAFKVCNNVLTRALKSLQGSSRGVKREVRFMLQTLEEDVRQLQLHLADCKGAASRAT